MAKNSVEEWLGRSIKGYRLEQILGVGGVGCVYRAKHPLIGKQVAIKLLQNTDPNEKVLGRFFTEARAANEIRHENVIDIIDFDQADEKTPFMIMEYLPGKSLAETIEQHAPFPESRIAHIARQICAALGAAHNRGIIHRDLKGDNVFLTQRGDDKDFVKILDFGIAKLLYENKNPTQTGLLIGTPLCIAPEQAKGTKVDHRVDIYALGVLLFQMCTGRAPFEHHLPMAIVSMHLEEQPPSPKQFNAKVSDRLETIIMRCLQKAPNDRFSSMEMLSAMLDGLTLRPSNQRAMHHGDMGMSVDMTSPFISLPPSEDMQRTQAAPRINAQALDLTPKEIPAEEFLKHNRSAQQRQETLTDAIQGEPTSIKAVRMEASAPAYQSGEQTAVGADDERSKIELAASIIKGNTISTKPIVEPTLRPNDKTQVASLFLTVVGVLMIVLLLAVLWALD
jgi:serine/threonine protein kinase